MLAQQRQHSVNTATVLEASTQKRTKIHAGNVFVTRHLNP